MLAECKQFVSLKLNKLFAKNKRNHKTTTNILFIFVAGGRWSAVGGGFLNNLKAVNDAVFLGLCDFL